MTGAAPAAWARGVMGCDGMRWAVTIGNSTRAVPPSPAAAMRVLEYPSVPRHAHTHTHTPYIRVHSSRPSTPFFLYYVYLFSFRLLILFFVLFLLFRCYVLRIFVTAWSGLTTDLTNLRLWERSPTASPESRRFPPPWPAVCRSVYQATIRLSPVCPPIDRLVID